MKVIKQYSIKPNYHFSELGIGDAFKFANGCYLHIKTDSNMCIVHDDLEEWVSKSIRDDTIVERIKATITYTE